jgi:hypothetical protein
LKKRVVICCDTSLAFFLHVLCCFLNLKTISTYNFCWSFFVFYTMAVKTYSCKYENYSCRFSRVLTIKFLVVVFLDLRNINFARNICTGSAILFLDCIESHFILKSENNFFCHLNTVIYIILLHLYLRNKKILFFTLI